VDDVNDAVVPNGQSAAQTLAVTYGVHRADAGVDLRRWNEYLLSCRVPRGQGTIESHLLDPTSQEVELSLQRRLEKRQKLCAQRAYRDDDQEFLYHTQHIWTAGYNGHAASN